MAITALEALIRHLCAYTRYRVVRCCRRYVGCSWFWNVGGLVHRRARHFGRSWD